MAGGREKKMGGMGPRGGIGVLSGRGVLESSEVVIKVGFGVLGWLLPLAYKNNPVWVWC